MKEVYSENPSGRIKGLSRLGVLLGIIVIIGGNLLTGPETFIEDVKVFFENISEEFEYEFDYGDDFDVDSDEVNELSEYISDNYITIVEPSKYAEYYGTSNSSFYKLQETYKFNYNETLGTLRLYKESNPYKIFNISTEEGEEWKSLYITGNKDLILVKLEGDYYDTYYFLTNDLDVKLKLQTPEKYEPVYSSTGYVYFGYETPTGIDVYEYNPITGIYRTVK